MRIFDKAYKATIMAFWTWFKPEQTDQEWGETQEKQNARESKSTISGPNLIACLCTQSD